MDDVKSLTHTKWNCKYHVCLPQNTEAIKEYIATQLKKDKEMSQMSIDDLDAPFTGSK